MARGNLDGHTIRRHDDDGGELRSGGECGQHIVEHGVRQLLPLDIVENARKALLGMARILDRDDGANRTVASHRLDLPSGAATRLRDREFSWRACARVSAWASTARASASRSSIVTISAFAAATGISSPCASAAST